MQSSFNENSTVDKLAISFTVPCPLKGSNERLHLTFQNTLFIKDTLGQPLETGDINIESSRSLYMTEFEKSVLQTAGSTFSATSYGLMGAVLVMNIFQIAGSGPFWSFVEMLQVAALLPLISSELPSSLQFFVSQYANVSKAAMPFSMLPSIVPKPTTHLEMFRTDPVNEQYKDSGYETKSFVYNFAEQLTTWVLLATVYGVVQLLVNMLPEGR